MADNNTGRLRILESTKDFCEDNDRLLKAVQLTRRMQEIIPETDTVPIPDSGTGVDTKTSVTDRKCLEAAGSYPGKKVCIINPGSATFPGGGAAEGRIGFEEELCYRSTYHKCLAFETCWKQFYLPHRKNPNPLHTDDIIYSPEIIVFKEIEDNRDSVRDEANWFSVDVLTCSPPEIKKPAEGEADIIDKEGLKKLLYNRCKRMLQIAHMKGAETVVLGDFGKGAYMSRPKLTAEAFRQVLEENPGWFETVEFAMGPTDRSKNTYFTYHKVIEPESDILK